MANLTPDKISILIVLILLLAICVIVTVSAKAKQYLEIMRMRNTINAAQERDEHRFNNTVGR